MKLLGKILRRINPPDMDATQAWFRLDLRDPDRVRRPLEDTFELRECGPEDLPLLAQLPGDPAVSTPVRAQATRRMSKGGTPWLSLENGKVAFGCWTFSGHAPVFGGRNGGAQLPAGSVMLEDSQTVPDFRGRGVAPATWSAIADLLAERGVEDMYTKVDVENIPSTKAVLKAGFREVGNMRIVRSRRRFNTTVDLGNDASDTDRWLLQLAS